jgi:inosine-uridine nucleoside N-ribohydrolase
MNNGKPKKIILDADIGWMNDDSTSAIFALKSSEIDILGITPVMGNFDLNWEVACALRLLEVLGHEDVPVCPGFDRPLLHKRDAYADSVWGGWATFKKFDTIPPGMPSSQPDPRHAVDFIAEMVRKYPGEVTIVAIGPLTNVAVAIRKYPDIISKIEQLVIMGGAFGTLPMGHGNQTLTAEFNFWVDAEAVRIVLESGIPTVLMPLNVCRKTRLNREIYERLASPDSDFPEVAELFRTYIEPHYRNAGYIDGNEALYFGLYDHTTLAYLINPDLFHGLDMSVEVSVKEGLDYGTSYGYVSGTLYPFKDDCQYPYYRGAPIIKVIHDLDFDGLVELYVSTLTKREI